LARKLTARLIIISTGALAGMPGTVASAQDNDQAIEALVAQSSSPAAAMAAARAQAAAGDLTGAAATLEAALLADPNANDARLLYAATLCRLGDLQAARIEIGKLDRQDISPSIRAEADQACGGAVRQPVAADGGSDGGLTGELYAGLAYDGDAAGAIALQTDFGFGASDREDGLAAIAGARLHWRSDGFLSGGGPYAGASLTSKHEVSGPDQDYDIGQVRAGYGRLGGGIGYVIGAVAGHTRLFGDPYVTEYGGQAELVFGNAQSRRIRFRTEGVAQDYDKGFPGEAADGARFDLSGALESRLGERGYYTVGVAGELKTADRKSFGYRGGRLFAAAYLALPSRHYLNLSGTLRYVDFRDDPPFADRKDMRGFARAAYGIPLGSGGLFVEGAGSYTLRKVSLSSTTGGGVPDLKTYRSPGAELRLIWKF
jgi:tetratricopeptide (TPR) repeat protein